MTDDYEAQGFAQMTAAFKGLDDLKERFATAAPLAPLSPLALDDRLWPSLPFSEHVRQCLASAVDHFDLVRFTVEARRTFPTGLNGVLRGSLVASAQAYWLVAPIDRDERQQRGLAFGDEWYYRRIQYQESVLVDIAGDERTRSKAQLAMLKSEKADAESLRTKRSELQATGAIEWAAKRVYSTPGLARATIREWNRLGGDAHALGWQLLVQQTEWEPRPDGESGPGAVRISGTLANIFEPYLCAWNIFCAALSRFDELAQAGEAHSVA